MLRRGVELVDSTKHVDKFDYPKKQIKLENNCLAEVKLLALRHRQQLVLGQAVLLLVGLVEAQALFRAASRGAGWRFHRSSEGFSWRIKWQQLVIIWFVIFTNRQVILSVVL